MLSYESKFFFGPNPFSRCGGLFVRLKLTQVAPLSVRQDHLIAQLAQLPVFRGDEQATSALLSGAKITGDTALGQMIRVVLTTLIADFNILMVPASASFTSDQKVVVFLPCECDSVGALAIDFILWLSGRWGQHCEKGQEPVRENSSFESDLHRKYWKARGEMRVVGLNQTNAAIARAALKRGIPVARLTVNNPRVLQLGWGRHGQRIFETATSKTNMIAVNLARDKSATRQVLMNHGLPVAPGAVVSNRAQLLSAAKKLGYPLVIKALTGGGGKHVVVGIQSQLELLEAAEQLGSQFILLEKFVEGSEYRFLVVNGSCVAIARRNPAQAIGDGRSTVRELVAEINLDPERGLNFEKLREKIAITEALVSLLAKQGMTLASVPELGRKVQLSRLSNIHQGGTSEDVTDTAHIDNKLMAERAARIIGLDVCGVDFICRDIRSSFRIQQAAILEVNQTPGLRPHIGANPLRDVARPIVDSLFKAGETGRIPTVAVTGSIGKTTTVHLIAEILKESHPVVAKSTTQGAWLGSEPVVLGDVAGGKMATHLLKDAGVDAGVFEMARGGLIKSGTVLDAVDVGILLNIHENHIGLDGVNSKTELLQVKRLVCDIATQLAIINADDPLCLSIVESLSAKHIGMISIREDNAALLSHSRQGGLVGFLDANQRLNVQYQGKLLCSLGLTECAISLSGAFSGVATNILAAMLASLALRCSVRQVEEGLRRFESTDKTNPKRNVLTVNRPFTLLQSHADGEVAAAELVRIASAHASGHRRIVLTSAGNRPDEFIVAMGRSVAGGFDDYIVTNSRYRRGRAPSEVPFLLKRGLLEGGVLVEKIRTETDLVKAQQLAEVGLSEGDILCTNVG